uniref:ATP synthase F0 subunit 8 n=1 Tax=Ceratovacuna keduensis TaxID=1217618 RepID=UPI002008EBF4|nr:ATP synthase F0 subunit 8 [Ceratovacuna keduensis]UOX27596.1 ATP synthase F0 subunit 8 [Ceratovacuna keduensis]
MPQMAPINWMILFFMFSMTMFLLSNLLYFNFKKKMKTKILIYKKKNYNKFI